MDKHVLLAQRNSWISWFYWITILSLINTGTNLMEGWYSFIIGLGYTQLLEGVIMSLRDELNQVTLWIFFTMSLLISGFFALAGYMTQRGRHWWYLAAMIIYAIDALIYGYVGDYVGVGFHIFALYFISLWYKSHRQLTQ